MAQVRIRIEADPVNDPWWRYHGKDIDDPLDKCFWETEPDKVIGTTRSWEPFRHSQTVDLPPGEHYVEYGNSADAGYYWKARIYINDELKAEGNVDRHNHLKATFRVEEAPPPPAPPASEDHITGRVSGLGTLAWHSIVRATGLGAGRPPPNKKPPEQAPEARCVLWWRRGVRLSPVSTLSLIHI